MFGIICKEDVRFVTICDVMKYIKGMKISKNIKILGILVLGLLSVLIFINCFVFARYRGRIYDVDTVDQRLIDDQFEDNQVAIIVFGAGIYNNSSPSDVLADRLQVAYKVYNRFPGMKILVSGDNTTENYNEPGVMREYLMDLGVAETDIVEDFAGRRTYDTCYRAQNIFGIDKAILVTQNFHLPRALYTCNNLGIDSIGVSSDLHVYLKIEQWKLREHVSRIVSFGEVITKHPSEVLGDKENFWD